jgi:hypothetical protein
MGCIAAMLDLSNDFSADSKKNVFSATSSVFSPTELKSFMVQIIDRFVTHSCV